jgi:hypothetical protein
MKSPPKFVTAAHWEANPGELRSGKVESGEKFI